MGLNRARRESWSHLKAVRLLSVSMLADMARTALPNRRLAQTIRFEHGGQRYFGTLGFPSIEDRLAGNVLEVFMDAGQPGSSVQHMARDGAVILSLALQYGCPIDVLRKAITRLDDGAAAGPFGKLLDMVGDQERW